MAKLLKMYNLSTFDDGTATLIEIVERDINQLLEESSEKMRQIILVLLHMKSERKKIMANGSQFNYSSLYNDSITYIADGLCINRNSVRDKLERQLSKSAADIRVIIEDYLENRNYNLKKVLLDSTKDSQRERQDKLLIEEFFK